MSARSGIHRVWKPVQHDPRAAAAQRRARRLAAAPMRMCTDATWSIGPGNGRKIRKGGARLCGTGPTVLISNNERSAFMCCALLPVSADSRSCDRTVFRFSLQWCSRLRRSLTAVAPDPQETAAMAAWMRRIPIRGLMPRRSTPLSMPHGALTVALPAARSASIRARTLTTAARVRTTAPCSRASTLRASRASRECAI